MTKEQKESYSAGGVVLNSAGDVCVVSQHGNSWSLPKGHLEKNEDALTAAKRETAEESGITQLQLLEKLGTYSRYRIGKRGGDDKKMLKHITMFLFFTPQMHLAPVDPENPTARWVNVDEVSDLLTHEKDKAFFLDNISTIKKAIKKLAKQNSSQ